jgi:lipopolysaccharide export system protein LptA
MKKILLVAFMALTAQATFAEKADRLVTGTIDYDTLDYDKVTRTSVLQGKVVLTKGTLVMKADKALVKEDADGNQFVTLTATSSTVATFRQKSDSGPDSWVEGQAQRIEYDGEKGLIKLFTTAKVKELENGKVRNELAHEYITYDSQKEVFTAAPDASGASKAGMSRGRIIMAPQLPKPAAGQK